MSEEVTTRSGDIQIDVSLDFKGGEPLAELEVSFDNSTEPLTDMGAAFGDWYKGEKGDKGDPFRFEDFTPEQLAELREGIISELGGEIGGGSGSGTASSSVLTFGSVLDFPSVGSADNLYIASDENASYRWNEADLHYYCVGRNYGEIETIDGRTI